jgi:hypothetical protein
MKLTDKDINIRNRGSPQGGIAALLRRGLLIAAGFALLCSMSGPVSAQSAFDDPGIRATGKGGAAGDMVPVQPVVDAGNISIGATAQVVVLFRNDSGRALESGAINLYPSSTVSTTIALNECSAEPLPPGAVCAVGLTIQGLQAGRWRVEMLMRHSGLTRLVTATLQGNVESSTESDANIFKSDIEAIPAELDFKKLSTSQPAVQPIVLRNVTSNPIDIGSIYVEAAEQAGFTFRTDCERLGPGQACIVTMIWSPILKGQATGVLVIEHNGPTTVASVPLLGEFIPDAVATAKTFPEAVPGKGLLVSSQDRIEFGSGIDTASAITVSLVNVGDAPLTIKDISLASSDNGLTISKTGCVNDLVLEPVQACPLTLTWTPVREGDIIDDVQIVHDGARGVLVLPVRGTSTGIVSKDNKAVRLSGDTDASVAAEDKNLSTHMIARDKSIDAASVLDGFIVTSHAARRSIITGPGGSRIVSDGEDVVIGGILWNVKIRPSGVELRSGTDNVLLLFDRALATPSSSSRNSSQSGGAASASTIITPK